MLLIHSPFVNCTIRFIHKYILRWKYILRIYWPTNRWKLIMWEPHGLCLKKRWNCEVVYSYREVNKKVHPDSMSIPQIQDILDSHGAQKYFTALDMSKAYNQGYKDRDSCSLTTFTIPLGLYEWLRIPFTFQCTPSFPKIYELMFYQDWGAYMHTILEQYSLLWKIFWLTFGLFKDSSLPIKKL